MFETSLNTINLSGTEFPIKCSLLVLEQIQDKYGDYKAFEDKIFRFTPDLDEKGEMIPMGEGMVRGKFGDPEVKISEYPVRVMALCSDQFVYG